MKKRISTIVLVVVIVSVIVILINTVDLKIYNNNYFGESDHYKATVTIKGVDIWLEFNGRLYHYDGGKSSFNIQYKGLQMQLSNIKKIEYEYDLGFHGGKGTINNPSDINITTSQTSGSLESIGSEVYVYVSTDGNEEIFGIYPVN